MDKTITSRVKSLLALKGKKNIEFAEYLGISPQSLQNKFNRGSFSADDLIKLADFLGVSLAFIEQDTKSLIELDKDCIRE